MGIIEGSLLGFDDNALGSNDVSTEGDSLGDLVGLVDGDTEGDLEGDSLG